jgi:hypothetical protein
MVFASLIMATNHVDAFAIDEKDRRLIVMSGADIPLTRAPNNLMQRVHAWMRDAQNIGALYRELQQRAASGVQYDPTGEPLDTEAKRRMIAEGKLPCDAAYDWILENAKGDCATMYQILQLAKQAASELDLILPAEPMAQFRHILQKRAKKPLHDQVRIKSAVVRPWVLRDFVKWDSDQIGPTKLRAEILKNGTPGGSLSTLSAD